LEKAGYGLRRCPPRALISFASAVCGTLAAMNRYQQRRPPQSQWKTVLWALIGLPLLPYLLIALIGLLAGCSRTGAEEDLGTRLRRECESTVRAFAAGPERIDQASQAQLVQHCIGRRGQLL